MPEANGFPYSPSLSLALVIDLDALAHNYHVLSQKLKKGTSCAVVLKANAYGMGLKEVSARLYAEGCRHFFVAHLTEAIELKGSIGKEAFIYVLNGLRKGDEGVYVHYNLIPVLSDLSQIRAWNSFCQNKKKCFKATLHFDTGMSRTGITPIDLKNLGVNDLSHTEITCIMSHLACPYESSNPMNEAQWMAFEAIRKRFPFAPASLSNSGGCYLDPKFHYNMVRLGLALTGNHPLFLPKEPLLKTVVKAYAQILQINEISRGDSVGYDATFIASRASRIATLGIGYADGYPRALSGQGDVFFEGHRMPIAGRVSMDLLSIDITDVSPSKIKVGDWMELFGDHISIDSVAKKANTIPWEMLTQLGPRYERFYLQRKNLQEVA